MVPCKSTAEEVLFEWPHHRILSTGSKVRTRSEYFGSEVVKDAVFTIQFLCNLGNLARQIA